MSLYSVVRNDIRANGSIVVIDSPIANLVAIDIRGTFVGTLQFESTIDGINWFAASAIPLPFTQGQAAVTSTTAPGAWIVNSAGTTQSRVRASAWTSGNASIVARAVDDDTNFVFATGLTTINGQTAHDGAVSGSPVRTATRAVTSYYTAVANGDATDCISTVVGVRIVKPYAIPEVEWAYTGALTTTADVAAQTAAGAGLKRHVTMLQATNTGGSAVDVLLRDGTTTRLQITVPAGQSVVFPLPTGIPVTANATLNVALSAVGTVRVNVLGYTAP